MQYKFVFVWYVNGKRKKSSEVEGTLSEMREYTDLALSWICDAEGRAVNVFSPGNFKTRQVQGVEEFFERARRHEVKMMNYVGD